MISILDVMIVGNSITLHNCVETKTFWTETVGNTILHVALCHPLYSINAIPVGKMLEQEETVPFRPFLFWMRIFKHP